MLDIIFYGSHYVKWRNIYEIMEQNNVDYRIHKFSGFNQKFIDIVRDCCNLKIYILDLNCECGLRVASFIRRNDIESVIIILTNNNEYLNNVFYNKLMIFDFICKNKGYEKQLYDDINAYIKFLLRRRIFSFTYRHALYRIYYNHINYIEKEPLVKRCIIHAEDNDYYIVSSIEKLEEELGYGFMRTHQSCIVNLNNVSKIDLNTNVIEFKNGHKTALLTDKAKKEIKKYVDVY